MRNLFTSHDYHFHSALSSCCGDPRLTPDVALAAAVERGYEAICLTDHLWDADTGLRVYRMAKKAGCLFYSASDAHTVENLNQVRALVPGVVDALGLRSQDGYSILALTSATKD